MIPSGGSATNVLRGMHAAQSRRRIVEAQLAACTQRVADMPGQACAAVDPVCQPVCGRRPRVGGRAPSGASCPSIRPRRHKESQPTEAVRLPRPSQQARNRSRTRRCHFVRRAGRLEDFRPSVMRRVSIATARDRAVVKRWSVLAARHRRGSQARGMSDRVWRTCARARGSRRRRSRRCERRSCRPTDGEGGRRTA